MDIKTVCNILGLKESKEERGLKFLDPHKPVFVDDSLRKIGIDALYVVRSLETEIPVIYFKELQSYDEDLVVDLHRRIWNEGRTPFLMLVLPHEIRVYNTFIPPPSEKSQLDQDTLVKTLALVSEVIQAAKQIREELSEFSGDRIETGELWKSKRLRFNRTKKIDAYLLENMKLVRDRLLKLGLSFRTINKLIIRSIFISYMQDRSILTPNYFHKIGNYSSFVEILGSRKDTYTLFEKINVDFNGDVFAITSDELGAVKTQHLELIAEFLSGSEFSRSHGVIQKSLFPYCFDTIPIELISSIYEEFLVGYDGKISKGHHYTPYHLAKLCLDSFYHDNSLLGKKVIDPSCGSGIFLVESYRRVIQEWYSRNKRKPDWEILTALLTDHIYGVDINEDAVNVAIFSLYLKMLDFLEPEEIHESEIKLPRLLNDNIYVTDFFNPRFNLDEPEFDYYIGNPPWGREESDSYAVKFCKENGYPISYNQIAQAFIWKIYRMAKNDAKACLIVHAKSVLFNKNKANRKFRRMFFERHNVRMIMNLSSMRHSLFRNAVGPAIITIYSFDGETKEVSYINPKTSYENKNSSYIMVNSTDRTNVPRKIFESKDYIWKILMWGSRIDYEIIDKISQFPSLEDALSEKGFTFSEGLQFGGGDKNKELRLKGMLIADTKDIEAFQYNLGVAETITTSIFHRPRSMNFAMYKAPHVLIRKNKLSATYIDEDLAFTDTIFGIHGEDIPVLKYIAVLINSHLMKYYFFLTASSWAVEREEINTMEIKSMPVKVPDEELLHRITALHDAVQTIIKKGEDTSEAIQELNSLIFEVYSITSLESQIINDTLSFDLSAFEKGTSSISFDRIDEDTLKTYVETLLRRLNDLLNLSNKFMNAQVYFSEGPLEIIVLSLDSRPHELEVIPSKEPIEQKLKELSESIRSWPTESIVLERDARLYLRDKILLIKFNERKFWSFKQAIIESNRLISEIVTGKKNA